MALVLRRLNWFLRLLTPDGRVERLLPDDVLEHVTADQQDPGQTPFGPEEIEAYWLLGQEHPVWWPEPQFLEWAESVG